MSTDVSNADAVEVEFELGDHDCFFVRASASAACRILLEDVVHRSDGKLLEFFTIEDAPVERVLSMTDAEPAIADARLVKEGETGNLFQFLVSGPCVTATLAEAGAVTRSVRAREGQGRVVAAIPPHVEVRTVVDAFQSRYADSELVAQRTCDHPGRVRTERGVQITFADRLTDKQLEVLRTAYLSGYFDWPRESTAAECADALGISQPTFSQHVRAAQHRIFETMFRTDTSR